MFQRKSRRRPRRAHTAPRKPAAALTFMVLYSATILLGAFAVFEWAQPLWASNPVLAVFIGGVFGVSALVTPSMIGWATRAKAWSKLGLLVACLAFWGLDTIGLNNAFNSYEQRATAAPYEAALAQRAADRKPITDDVAKARAKLDAIPAASIACAGFGPLKTEQCRQGLKDDQGRFHAALTRAEGQLVAFDALPAPQRGDLYDNRATLALSIALQLGLALCFGCLTATRDRIHQDATADFRAAKVADSQAKLDAKVAIEKEKTKRARIEAKGEPNTDADERASIRQLFSANNLVAANDTRH